MINTGECGWLTWEVVLLLYSDIEVKSSGESLRYDGGAGVDQEPYI